MSRMLTPLWVNDVSSFSKNLKSYLDERQRDGKTHPGHVELLNLIARAAGWRNYQALKAVPPIPTKPALEAHELTATARKTLQQFDAFGRLVRLPNKLSVQQMAMWWMWTHFTARRKYTEQEVNRILNAHHTFGDQATLRRELVNMKLLGRKSDCSEYWKEPMRPNAEVQGFLQAMRHTVAVQ